LPNVFFEQHLQIIDSLCVFLAHKSAYQVNNFSPNIYLAMSFANLLWDQNHLRMYYFPSRQASAEFVSSSCSTKPIRVVLFEGIIASDESKSFGSFSGYFDTSPSLWNESTMGVKIFDNNPTRHLFRENMANSIRLAASDLVKTKQLSEMNICAHEMVHIFFDHIMKTGTKADWEKLERQLTHLIQYSPRASYNHSVEDGKEIQRARHQVIQPRLGTLRLFLDYSNCHHGIPPQQYGAISGSVGVDFP
jgi:hypothetical protein